jgi:hypothetical protein
MGRATRKMGLTVSGATVTSWGARILLAVRGIAAATAMVALGFCLLLSATAQPVAASILETATLAEVERWVMKGGAGKWNYLRTGLWGPRIDKARKCLWKASKPEYEPHTMYVPKGNLKYPLRDEGPFGFFKGLLGQRKLVP